MHQILKYRLTCVLQGLTPALISRYSQLSVPMGSASNQLTAYVFSMYFFVIIPETVQCKGAETAFALNCCV